MSIELRPCLQDLLRDHAGRRAPPRPHPLGRRPRHVRPGVGGGRVVIININYIIYYCYLLGPPSRRGRRRPGRPPLPRPPPGGHLRLQDLSLMGLGPDAERRERVVELQGGPSGQIVGLL